MWPRPGLDGSPGDRTIPVGRQSWTSGGALSAERSSPRSASAVVKRALRHAERACLSALTIQTGCRMRDREPFHRIVFRWQDARQPGVPIRLAAIRRMTALIDHSLAGPVDGSRQGDRLVGRRMRRHSHAQS